MPFFLSSSGVLHVLECPGPSGGPLCMPEAPAHKQKSRKGQMERSGPASSEQASTRQDRALQGHPAVSHTAPSLPDFTRVTNKAGCFSTHLSHVHDFDGCQLTRLDMSTLEKRERSVSTGVSPIPSTHTEQNIRTRAPAAGFSPAEGPFPSDASTTNTLHG